MFGKVAVPAVLALGNPGGRVAAVEGVGATAVKTVGTAEKVAAEFAEATVSKGAEAAAEIRSAAQEVKLLGTARDNLLHAAQNPRLRDAINNLYRPGSKLGSGSSMDALRIEGSHLEKVLGRRTQLQRIVNEETLNATERKIARDLLIDIQDALSKHIGAP
jgi:hypothetical protein